MGYIPTIGLEMHCELKSNSKVFSRAKNSNSLDANSLVMPLDMAFPGTMPVLNKECIRKAIMISKILNCEVADETLFDRKNYYYPDLPKGYQITQVRKPIGTKGKITVDVGEETKEFYVHDVHLEEDTANMTHLYDCTLIDYNRCGVPLIEIVSEPCMHSVEDAISYLEYIRSSLQYADLSDADVRRGQVRCDVNVSVQEEVQNGLGTRVEIKNVNSFTTIKEVIVGEINRQISLIESGKKDEIIQETRRYDENLKTTVRMREKVDAVDYKYFVEPNIPRIKIDPEWVKEIENSIPVLPQERKHNYMDKYGLTSSEAKILVRDKEYSDYFEKLISLNVNPKLAYNWITTQVMGSINENHITLSEFFMTPERLAVIIKAIEENKISSKQAKEIYEKSIEENKEPSELLKSSGAQINDEAELETLIDEILSKNPDKIEAYHNGKTNLFDFFVGQVMKETKGKANPVKTKEILSKKL